MLRQPRRANLGDYSGSRLAEEIAHQEELEFTGDGRPLFARMRRIDRYT
tara:strand:+ start:1408 stop:1554 length:147 start_codon:yes stop_codon:yes gene_type:complete